MIGNIKFFFGIIKIYKVGMDLYQGPKAFRFLQPRAQKPK